LDIKAKLFVKIIVDLWETWTRDSQYQNGCGYIGRKYPQKLPAQIVCPSQKVWDFEEKRLHWVFVVRDWRGVESKERR
jgi:hypothetical protein